MGSEARSALKADSSIAICEQIASNKREALKSQNPMDLHGLLRGWLHFILYVDDVRTS
jgi:hypothetical protein